MPLRPKDFEAKQLVGHPVRARARLWATARQSQHRVQPRTCGWVPIWYARAGPLHECGLSPTWTFFSVDRTVGRKKHNGQATIDVASILQRVSSRADVHARHARGQPCLALALALAQLTCRHGDRQGQRDATEE